jgi:hypothetical protein
MGFYTVHCKKCDQEMKVMCKYEDLETLTCGARDYWDRPMLWIEDGDEKDKLVDEGCGNIVERIWKPQEAVFAIAGSSLDTHGVHNVNGYYSPSFGRYFKNKHKMHEWAENNGWKSVSASEADNALGQQYEDIKKQDKINQTYADNLKEHKGDKVAAAAKTFVPKNMQDK